MDIDLILASLQMFDLGKSNVLIEVVAFLLVGVFVEGGLVNKQFDQSVLSVLQFIQPSLGQKAELRGVLLSLLPDVYNDLVEKLTSPERS